MKYAESYPGVKTCHVCGKTALYHYGNVGACRQHRDRVQAIARKYADKIARLTRPRK